MMAGVNNSNNLYKEFSGINYNNPREYLEYTHKFDPLPTPSTVVNTNIHIEEKPVKKKTNKILGVTLATVGVVILGVLAKKGLKAQSAKKIIKNTASQLSKIGNSKIVKKGENVLCNINNIKDDILDRFLKYKPKKHKVAGYPSKFFNTIGEYITNLYKKISRKTLSGNYTNAYEKVQKAGGGELGIQNFNSWFDNLEKEMNEALHESPKGRITSWKELTNCPEKGFKNKIKQLFSNLTTKNIANERLNEVIINGQKTIEIDPKWSDELKEAVQEFNKVKLKTSERLIPRLRDIVCGTAPSDLITLTTGTALGAGLVITADTPEERKNTIISKGIPIGFTMGSYALSALLNLSGAKGLAIGFTLGKVAEFIVSKIDKKHAKNEDVI